MGLCVEEPSGYADIYANMNEYMHTRALTEANTLRYEVSLGDMLQESVFERDSGVHVVCTLPVARAPHQENCKGEKLSASQH